MPSATGPGAPECAHSICRRRTRHPSGRCPDHRTPYRIADVGSGAPPLPSPASEQKRNGRLHRETWPNGSIRSDDWLDDRERHHRLDGPAETRYYPSGYPQTEKWAFEGVLHREDGPAVIEHYLDGGRREEWWVEDRKHRVDGPAESYFRADGEMNAERYFVRGVEFDEKVFRKYVEALESGAPHEWAWSYAHAFED